MQKDLHCVNVQFLKEDGQTLEDTTEMVNLFSSSAAGEKKDGTLETKGNSYQPATCSSNPGILKGSSGVECNESGYGVRPE